MLVCKILDSFLDTKQSERSFFSETTGKCIGRKINSLCTFCLGRVKINNILNIVHIFNIPVRFSSMSCTDLNLNE